MNAPRPRASRKISSLTADPAVRFYVDVLQELNRARIPALLGGAYALSHYVGYARSTKDLDLFVMPADAHGVLREFAVRGYDTELTFSHWLGKIRCGPHFCDVIFSSGNGIARVDDQWFEHAIARTLFGVPVRLMPPEEMIWSKAFVQERERYDGADVMHLLYHCGRTLDWKRLLERFGPHWRVLFSFVVLFGFAYPSARDRIPSWVIDELTARFVTEPVEPGNAFCNGTLLSREQYLPDVAAGGFVDPRRTPHGRMRPDELERWTEAIGEKH